MDDILISYYTRLKLSGISKSTVKIERDKKGYVLFFVDYSYPDSIFKVPDFIYRIDDSCFSGTKLKKVVISESVVEVGENCFANCNVLEEILIPIHLLGVTDILRKSNKAKITVNSSRRF